MAISPIQKPPSTGNYQYGNVDKRPIIIAAMGLLLGGTAGFIVGNAFIWTLAGAVIGLITAILIGEFIFGKEEPAN